MKIGFLTLVLAWQLSLIYLTTLYDNLSLIVAMLTFCAIFGATIQYTKITKRPWLKALVWSLLYSSLLVFGLLVVFSDGVAL